MRQVSTLIDGTGLTENSSIPDFPKEQEALDSILVETLYLASILNRANLTLAIRAYMDKHLEDVSS